MEGYRIFRRDRQGRRFGGVALCVRECFDVDTRKKFFSKRVVLHRLKAVGSLLWLVEAVWHAATFVAPAQAPVPLPSVLG